MKNAGSGMRKLTKHIIAVAGRILFMGFTVQIIFGIVWMAVNFAHCQHFEEADSLLYPAVLMIAKGMGRIFPVPYYCFVYIFQAGLCLYSVYFFEGVILAVFFSDGTGATWNAGRRAAHSRLFRLWSAMAVATAVPVMQCVMALLPYSLTGSLLLTELGIVIKTIFVKKRLSVQDVVKLLILWALSALLLHEYLLFGALPTVIATASQFFRAAAGPSSKERITGLKRAAYKAAAAAVALGMLSAVYGVCESRGIYEEKNPNLIKGLFSRTCLTTVLWDWDTWTDELVDGLAWEVRYSAAYYADNITLEVEPYIDERYGGSANEFYLSTISAAWQSYRTDIIHETLWDIAGYAISPVIIRRQLSGLGYMSLTARNYDMMKRTAPRLTKYYVNFFLDWFIAALVIAAVCAVFAAADKMIRKHAAVAAALSVAPACMCVRYALMGAGIMDYKRTLIITALWIIFIQFPIFGQAYRGEADFE